MENLLESNERTLILFDAVCSGLSECLALVHGDIRQMTEHRNKLVQLEQEQIQAKLIPAQELIVVTNNQKHYLKSTVGENNNNINNQNNNNFNSKSNKKKQSKINAKDDDPHHLAGLKLLDKRLADSFSHALSLNDLQKTSIAAKQHANHSKPSIFQVLLGKSSRNNGSANHKNNKTSNNYCPNGYDKDGTLQYNDKIDNRMVIDDINRQTRLAMQYLKQLEAQLLKVEDLRCRYEMHLKMGLVVRSVSRAYLANGSSSTANSPSSLARNHCSSLVINDSSSIGTHSSLSSLNLSTWSSSRSKQRAAAAAAANNNNNQMFVSTLSLNNKQSKRINLAKLISSSSIKGQQESSSHYEDPQMAMSNTKQRRISSHSIGQSNRNSYYNDWTIPESTATYAHINKPGTLSKSNNNLTSSHLSLKGRKSKQSAESKTTIKEFIDNIDKIETEFESYMGTFLLVVEDIQGFARVCQGDVFEITIKYGDAQKFKSKISVLKDNKQKCDNKQTFFKARIADILAIKAYECKGLGKRVLLGHKLCETRDLFTARSQLMTISLNQTGSIKLNLVVTWNPLHMAPNSSSALPGVDISHISLPPTPVSSTLSSLSSGPSLNGTTTSISIQSQHRNKCMNSSNSIENQELQQESMYQPVDPTYGYYIPPPDYLTNELNH